MLLRVILAAYARGFTSSRQIERLCKENVVFIALSGDSQPHFTTLAKFVAQMSDVIQSLFTEVLMVCDARGLIGGDLFAIDGCKMPSNASKEWSGTIKEMTKKQKKINRAVRRMLQRLISRTRLLLQRRLLARVLRTICSNPWWRMSANLWGTTTLPDAR